MKKSFFIFLAFSLVIVSCSKGGDPTPTPVPIPPVVITEATLAYGIDIDPGAGNIYAALGATQSMNINLSSAVPTSGIQIDVLTKKDSDGSTVSSSSISSTSASNAITIVNLQQGVLCTTKVTITSKTTASSTVIPSPIVEKSFKIARK